MLGLSIPQKEFTCSRTLAWQYRDFRYPDEICLKFLLKFMERFLSSASPVPFYVIWSRRNMYLLRHVHLILSITLDRVSWY